ncbi:MAG TPA: hypothetical protein VFR97_12090 [Capillimicrobium sp.]|nr:hypothetical protein [Capillimicrobium sp.]
MPVATAGRACEAPPPGTTFVDTPPSAALVEQLAILRRPQTAEDLAAIDRLGTLPLGRVHRSGVRVAHAADGRSYVLYPSTARRPASRRCRGDVPWPPVHRISVFTEQPDGTFGGGGLYSAGRLRTYADGFGSFGGGPGGEPTILYALVRDGVARVTWVFQGGLRATGVVQDNIAAGEIAAGPLGLRLERTIYEAADGTILADVEA